MAGRDAEPTLDARGRGSDRAPRDAPDAGEAGAPAGPADSTQPAPPGPPALNTEARGGEPPPFRYWNGVEIARGGMGRVVEATDTLLGRVVAVKEALTNEPEAIRRFLRETRITARLEHPSIVPVYDAGRGPDGAPFYVMRKVSGRPLESLMKATRTLADRLALVPHIVAAAGAVAHAHERGIIHRDLKPSNILVGTLGETVVIDWGLAKVIGETDDVGEARVIEAGDSLRTRVGEVFGTPGFMAPEQLRGDPVDARGDVYALGATLYHLLSGKPPHYAEDSTAMMRAAESTPAPPIRAVLPTLPLELSAIIDKALAHDDRARYQDAGALAADLQRFLTGQLVDAHRYSKTQRVRRFVRRHRAVVGVSVAASVTLAVIAWLAVGRVVDARDRASTALRTALVEKQAADDARGRETERANDLLLMQAETMIATNPTAAVALVRPLVDATHWRRVRAIAMAARSAGVAWSVPGPLQQRAISMSSDGNQVLTADVAGELRLTDLRARSSRVVTTTPVSAAALVDGDRLIVVMSADHLRYLDVATGAVRRELAVPGPVHEFVATDQTVYWSDWHEGAFRYTLGDRAITPIPVKGPIQDLEASPDGARVAIATNGHIVIFDRADQAPPREIVTDTTVMRWRADGTQLAVGVRAGVEIYDVTPTAATFARRAPGLIPTAVAWLGPVAYFGPAQGGLQMTWATGHNGRGPPIGTYTTLATAADNTVVALDVKGAIHVFSPDRDLELHSPMDELRNVVASPRSHFVVGVAAGRLVVWDLAAVLPTGIPSDDLAGASFGSPDELVVMHHFGPWEWINLRTGVHTPMPVTRFMGVPVAAEHGGDLIIANRNIGEPSLLVHRDPPSVETLPIPISVVAFPEGRAVIATPKGDVVEYEVATGRHHTLLNHVGNVTWIYSTRSSLLVLYDDGTVWRRDRQGRETTLRLPAPPPGRGIAGRLDDGDDALLARDRTVLRWSVDGSVRELATLAQPIADLFRLDPRRLFVSTLDHAGFFVGDDGVVSGAFPVGHGWAAVSVDHQLGVAIQPNGVLEATDFAAGLHWELGHSPLYFYQNPALWRDARAVVINRGNDNLAVFDLSRPDDEAGTRRWLDELTNATAAHGPAVLDWR